MLIGLYIKDKCIICLVCQSKIHVFYKTMFRQRIALIVNRNQSVPITSNAWKKDR